jgi:hypothetical protein
VSAFLYFVAADAPPNGAQLAAWGLSHAFPPGVEPSTREVQFPTPAGPTVRGFLVADPNRYGAEPPIHRGAEQTWQPMPAVAGAPERWIGWWNDRPPIPSDLALDRGAEGLELTDATGRSWVVPIVRRVLRESLTATPTTGLPCYYRRDPLTGRMVPGDVVDAYRAAWDATEWAWDALLSGEEIDEEQCLETAAVVLGINYAVGAEELLALRVFSTDLGPAAWLWLACGGPSLRAWTEARKGSDPTEPLAETRGGGTSAGGAA